MDVNAATAKILVSSGAASVSIVDPVAVNADTAAFGVQGSDVAPAVGVLAEGTLGNPYVIDATTSPDYFVRDTVLPDTYWIINTTSPVTITADLTDVGTSSWSAQTSGGRLLGTWVGGTATFTTNSQTLLHLQTDTPALIGMSTQVAALPGAVLAATDCDRSPGLVTVTGANFPAATSITIQVSSSPSANVISDAQGGFSSLVEVPVLPVGQHYVSAATADGVATAVFSVLSILSAPTTPPTDADVTITPSAAPVVKWMLTDQAVGGLAPFEFPINPSSMADPFGSKLYTTVNRVGVNSAPVIWEGESRAVEWSFEGTLLTQAHYEGLRTYARLGRRFQLRDHRNRVWIVTFSAFEPVPKRALSYPWAHNYTVRALVYGLKEG